MATNAIRCPLCAYQVLRLQQLVSHLRLVHSGDPNFELVCGIGGCRQRFGAFSAFNSHVYRFHRAALGLSDEQLMPSDEENLPSNSQEAVSDMTMDCDSCGIEPPPCISDEICDPTLQSSEGLEQQTAAAKFLLGLKASKHISQAAVDEVVDGCEMLISSTVAP